MRHYEIKEIKKSNIELTLTPNIHTHENKIQKIQFNTNTNIHTQTKKVDPKKRNIFIVHVKVRYVL